MKKNIFFLVFLIIVLFSLPGEAAENRFRFGVGYASLNDEILRSQESNQASWIAGEKELGAIRFLAETRLGSYYLKGKGIVGDYDQSQGTGDSDYLAVGAEIYRPFSLGRLDLALGAGLDYRERKRQEAIIDDLAELTAISLPLSVKAALDLSQQLGVSLRLSHAPIGQYQLEYTDFSEGEYEGNLIDVAIDLGLQYQLREWLGVKASYLIKNELYFTEDSGVRNREFITVVDGFSLGAELDF
ncbi:DUF4856 domain-containing protein [Natroniella sulfidigena]|uniref:DUF4856 domain-containing protein n=1 Tax=Natroniella sulfidigena TaxID=723921 RepID=UPI00200B3B98|nr:DUF4856 domain-containing protein [Natroniella sulfidigena]MCK8816337.1 DUF4856 domain-containing protein [Natroniella sulfidigena]